MSPTLLATLALAALPLAQAHVALWHPSMFGWVPTDIQQQEPVNPLYNLPFSEWWGHGYTNKPPADGVYMELPAGGTFHGEVACNRCWTSWGPNGTATTMPWACDSANPLHTTDVLGTENPVDVQGCGLAIAYESDITKVTPEQMVVFSTNHTCPWKRHVDFQIPSDLPACPPGGCICSWNWIHAPDSGSEQIYNLLYRCQVTGASNTRALTKTPYVANKCPTDKSNCTTGPKVPFYWLQAERNNFFQGYYDPPYYNSDYGFANGAQTDLFVNVPPVSPSSISSSAAVSSTKAPSSASTAAFSSKASSASSTAASSIKASSSAASSATSSKPSSASVTSTPASSTTKASSSTSASSTKASSSSASSSSSSSSSAKPSSTTSSSAAPAATPAAVSSYTYVGCRMDNATRAIPGTIYGSNALTPQTCATQCAGSTYVGVENGSQCFCGNTLTFNVALDASKCATKCSGDGTQTCGGSWAVAIWSKTSGASSTAAPSNAPASASASGCAPTKTVTVTITAAAASGTAAKAAKRAGSIWSRSRLVWAALTDGHEE